MPRPIQINITKSPNQLNDKEAWSSGEMQASTETFKHPGSSNDPHPVLGRKLQYSLDRDRTQKHVDIVMGSKMNLFKFYDSWIVKGMAHESNEHTKLKIAYVKTFWTRLASFGHLGLIMNSQINFQKSRNWLNNHKRA